jgi:HSP90 family molecular chaperone
MTDPTPRRSEFKAEIRQVLDILIHSLYTEKEIFLRELISNASDALNRSKLENLQRQEVVSPGAELAIYLEGDPETRTLTVRDSGIGLSAEEMEAYLGTIAHSGAKRFIETLREGGGDPAATREVIGQFGVGFYSVFMVADEVTVTSRSFDPAAAAARWRSDGQGTYEVGPADVAERGTTVTIKLREDAQEFAEPGRLRALVKAHSDFVAFPIYLKEGGEWRQVNARTALWREAPRSVEAETYTTFYQQLTFDAEPPLTTIHFAADLPIQFYALLFVPSRRDLKLLNTGDYGLRLYARKVLIDPAFRELLPPYLRFLEGVVDSEDLPLNVSRELVQATPAVARIRKAIVGRVTGELERLAADEPETYARFYREFGSFLKEGIASDRANTERFLELLRFPTSRSEGELVSLQAYVERMKPEQREIYYVLGDDVATLARSAHLEGFRQRDLEVLYLSDPLDPFLLLSLSEYGGKPFRSVDAADLELPATGPTLELPKDEGFVSLTAFVKGVLGERVAGVRESKLLEGGAARLVNPAGETSSLYRAQRLMGQGGEVPRKILELNPKSELIQSLGDRLRADDRDPLLPVLVEQLFENELLAEGLHPNPAAMIPRLRQLMAAAVKGRAAGEVEAGEAEIGKTELDEAGVGETG